MGLFDNGAAWVKADFHLHTRADHEFAYEDQDRLYLTSYVQALAAAGLHVGVVSNHNKFAFQEFMQARSMARKKDVFLLPGVELSVNNGPDGTHVIVVFPDSWLTGNLDLVSPFLSELFPGETEDERQSDDALCGQTLLQVVEGLDQTGHDYFLVFAHVEDKNGLFAELGDALADWQGPEYDQVRARTLGFQKVRSAAARDAAKQALGGWYPAEVEGSDPKNIQQIGQFEPPFNCYIKINGYSYEAVKEALANPQECVKTGEA